MVAGVVLNNLDLKPGQRLEVKGFIPPDAKCFSINMGENDSNYSLHMNPRFDHEGEVQTIVLNSKTDNTWGTEQREDSFPFQQGSETLISFEFQRDKINIQLDNGKVFSFPVRQPPSKISYLSLEDLQFRNIKIV